VTVRTSSLLAILPLVVSLSTVACSSAPVETTNEGSGSNAKTLPADDAQALSLSPVQYLRDSLDNALEGISASNQAAYMQQSAALGFIESQVRKAGITDPTTATYILQPKTFALGDGIPFDHSEVDIVKVVSGAKSAAMRGRILGDIWGAGLYNDTLNGCEMGPPLCVTWDELVAAINVSYVNGFYLGTFVCHDITFRVLDTLGVSVKDYSHLRGWTLASYAFGPIFANTDSASAASSDPVQACVSEHLAKASTDPQYTE
jgi:hypothetical protein